MSLPLTIEDFTAFFRAVHIDKDGNSKDPFPWQQRLLQHLVDGRTWPGVLDLPTGSGKTSTLDIAVFHLALEADLQEQRKAPVRIAFVVDRRLVVDDAYSHAKKIALALRQAKDEATVIGRVATALRKLAGSGEDDPLLVRKLRGGTPREDDWARTPIQPTIVCSTVDQVGSRLLFRGYGVSARMQPIHAGLLGSDCLILLDEAHLSEAFRQTVSAIVHAKKSEEAPLRVAVLSATPGRIVESVFQLDEADIAHPILARRMNAPKPARLIEILGKQGVSTEERRVEEYCHQALLSVESLQKQDIQSPVVAIVVNRVARARAVFTHMTEQCPLADVKLIIGPARSIDRDAVVEALKPIRTGCERHLDKPLVLVATQTIEVGIDIDLDALITEVAPLDALRQRFGRLNRDGRMIKPFSVILAHKDEIGSKSIDPIYGKQIAATWKFLQSLQDASHEVHFGISDFEKSVSKDEAAKYVAPKADAPIVLPAYIDLWSQTWPMPNATPEVALFLHGPRRTQAGVQIIWRTEASLGEDRKDVIVELLAAVPPRSSEAIEIPVKAARAWLGGFSDRTAFSFSDAIESDDAPEEDDAISRDRYLRWCGSDNEKTGFIAVRKIKAGDIIIVDPSKGGCDRWGWNPESTESVFDGAAIAALDYARRGYTICVMPEHIGPRENPKDQEDAKHSLKEILREYQVTDGCVMIEAILERLSHLLPQRIITCLSRMQKSAIPNTKKGKKQKITTEFISYTESRPENKDAVIFRAPYGLKLFAEDEADLGAVAVTESDQIGTFPGYTLELDQHAKHVREFALRFTRGVPGIRHDVADDLVLAAYLHDWGKADARFQNYLASADPLGWDGERVLAKSGGASFRKTAWDDVGLPKDWRHEALSVRLVQHHQCFQKAKDPVLVLWLIGVHHGFGRPFFPHTDPKDQELMSDLGSTPGFPIRSLAAGRGPQSLEFQFQGMDWPQMFVDLKRRYGVWELARLEAILRLADHRASEEAGQS